jgi:hypothetical protein
MQFFSIRMRKTLKSEEVIRDDVALHLYGTPLRDSEFVANTQQFGRNSLLFFRISNGVRKVLRALRESIEATNKSVDVDGLTRHRRSRMQC